MRTGFAVVPLLLMGCGRYDEFQLPAPEPGPDRAYRWEVKPAPVLARGAAGEWDSVDALNPSVVRFGGRLLNIYSGFDGKVWHTGVASSPDGVEWKKEGKVLSPAPSTWEGNYIAANGSALAEDGKISYWYQAGNPPRIGLARSSDGRSWTREPMAVLELGPVGSWDERGIGDPYVIRAGDQLYMFYLGADRAGRQRLGVARSADGIRWTKLRSNPILELGDDRSFDENGLGEPAVWGAGGYYWMLYTGRDRSENRRIGLARSRNGVEWERSGAIPVLAGQQSWNNKVVCDPTVEVTPDGIRVWFGGGNVARPDERLNGEIGYAELRALQP